MKSPHLAHEVLSLYRRGEFKSAEQVARKALATAPRDPNLLQLLAASLVGQGRANEAVELLEKAINTSSATGEILYNLGTALASAGRHNEAAQRLKQACIARPQDPDCHNNLGLALLSTNQYSGAEVAFGRALKLRPDWPFALYHKGRAAAAQGKHQEALNDYSRAISIGKTAPAEVMLDMGNSFRDLKRHEEALASYNRALALKPDLPEAHNGRGNALIDLNRAADALASYDRALALRPDFYEAHLGRGNALSHLKRATDALSSYDRALAYRPDLPEGYNGRGNALIDLNRPAEALASYDRALLLKPDLFAPNQGRGRALKDLQRLDESLASFARALALNAESVISLYGYLQTALQMCDWTAATIAATDLVIGRKNQIVEPFIILPIRDDPAMRRSVAEAFVMNRMTTGIKPVESSRLAKPQKLRLGYLSADFRQHPVGVLMAELVELHDRSHFEVYGFSAGLDDQSAVYQRLKSAFDVFVDVRSLSDARLRQAIQEAQIDIIVDLGGHTIDGRLFALAHRAAPIQVTYLGYPGTTGAPFLDYAIVDEFVVPRSSSKGFTEKLVYLPHCYLVSDRKRPIAQHRPSRAEFGIPDEAFVFCCFNSPHKINAPVFDVWMSVLAAVPGSVLWLLQSNKWASENLRKEARIRGVDPARLVFAPQLSYAEHLAALRLADLFLDTWPYNAHTTASDALWVGLPVLTCSGRTFAARVAGSLLYAIDVPELVTYSADDYGALAVKLGLEPSVLEELRHRLAANINTAPLFQTDLFARHIEAGFKRMWERHQRGEKPESFTVGSLQRSCT